ncbi:MAG: secondary thiamine-phosphate synthase enzyme YjbQ [Phycisphaerae bacterium]|nr:secondary thiamine-phosphate synthase enzyme YjbQ [Phycisphaerae bacterium]
MSTFYRELSIQTQGGGDVIDLSDALMQLVKESGIRNGQALCFVRHSTAALTTLEHEPGLLADMKAVFERLAPAGAEYEHHKRWGDHNGHSHVLAAIFGPSVGIPIVDGRLMIGTWQRPVLLDFDVAPRQRSVSVQIVGE